MSKRRTIRIECDGPTSNGVAITDTLTGESLLVYPITDVRIEMGVGHLNRAVLTFEGVEVDVVAEVAAPEPEEGP